MKAICVASLSMLFAVAVSVAEEPKTKAPTGAFTRKAGDFELTFTFQKEMKLNFLMKNQGGDGMKFESTYTLDKEGKLELTIVKAEKIGEFQDVPEKGTKYSFKIAMKEKKLFLSELKGEHTENAKDLVEGEYEPSK